MNHSTLRTYFGILGFILQYLCRSDQVTRKKTKLLSGLRTTFMLIPGWTSDFYQIFITVGKLLSGVLTSECCTTGKVQSFVR